MPADVLFHHVALLNKKIRAGLPTFALLDQPKELTVNANDENWLKPTDSLKKNYAFMLVDRINIKVGSKSNLKQVKAFLKDVRRFNNYKIQNVRKNKPPIRIKFLMEI